MELEIGNLYVIEGLERLGSLRLRTFYRPRVSADNFDATLTFHDVEDPFFLSQHGSVHLFNVPLPRFKPVRGDQAPLVARAEAALPEVIEKPSRLRDTANRLNGIATAIHDQNVRAGWWNDIETGADLHGRRNVGELLCLVHSEVSEAMEAHRKSLMDDKLPHRTGFEVELADAVIRIFDICGGYKLDLGGALVEKLAYNKQRSDHKIENRRAAGGKAY